LRVALSIEMLALFLPIATCFVFMVDRSLHPISCEGVCKDPSAFIFLVCVAIFGPGLWLATRLSLLGLEAKRRQVVWLAIVNVYVAAAMTWIVLTFSEIVAWFIPAAGWLTAAVILVMALASIAAIAEPPTPLRY
jgi:hypothetical protein